MPLSNLQNYVQQCGLSPANLLGPDFYREHLVPVAKFSAALAEPLGADRDVVETAAHLHDLSAMLDFRSLPTHADDSAALARKLLREEGYETAFIEKVAGSIALHSTPLTSGMGSPEAVCLSNADAMAFLDRPAYWLFFAVSIRKLPFADARSWLETRSEAQWAALTPEARPLVEDAYRDFQRFLRTA